MNAFDPRLLYRSGEWELDLAGRELRMGGVAAPLGGRAFEILVVLVQAAGRIVTKDDLMARIWPGTIVDENRIQVHISAVRKALGSDRDMLKTASGRGYRLAGDWIARHLAAPGEPDAAALVAPPVRPIPAALPSPGFELIGRAASLQQLQDLLSAYRAVTLTGTGGIGKTALALEVARSHAAGFAGEGCFVELAGLADPRLVPSAVAGALGLSLGDAEISAESVGRAIGGRNLLLVLDNCEHLIDAAARLTETLIKLCPHTAILSTSREVLRIDGEHVYRVPPLDVPSEQETAPEAVLRSGAVQLFIARARAADAGFAAPADSLPAIAGICRRLDGIPLALEFAAARTATLGLREVAARLDDRFALLVGGRRTALPRHQTLRAALDWSYELLSPDEQHQLRRLGVFVGGFTLEAAIAVAPASATVVEDLANLVAKSLVTLDAAVPIGRWRLLETVRAYALEKLAETGAVGEVARRHAAFFADLFASGPAAPALAAAREAPGYDARELDNVRTALDWAFSPTGDAALGIALTAAYAPVWYRLSLQVECRARTQAALDRLDAGAAAKPNLRIPLLVAHSVALMITMGSAERALAALAQALEAADVLADQAAQLQVLGPFCASHHAIGHCRASQPLAERYLRLARSTGNPLMALMAERQIGSTLLLCGRLREAQRCLERVVALHGATSDHGPSIPFRHGDHVIARAMLARALWLRGLLSQAGVHARASVERARATGDRLLICIALSTCVCPIALATGDYEMAAQAVATIRDLATRHNSTLWKTVARYHEGKLLVAQGAFEAGVAALDAVLDQSQRTGWMADCPEYAGALADGLARHGRHADALGAVDRALACAARGGELWLDPELLRLKGEILQQAEGRTVPEAEACFDRAIGLAREQGASFWELRCTLSLARLRLAQDRHHDARQLLAPLCDRFTEGLDSLDGRAAEALLATCGGP